MLKGSRVNTMNLSISLELKCSRKARMSADVRDSRGARLEASPTRWYPRLLKAVLITQPRLLMAVDEVKRSRSVGSREVSQDEGFSATDFHWVCSSASEIRGPNQWA